MWTGRAGGGRSPPAYAASFHSFHFFWREAGASPPPWGREGRHLASQNCALVSSLPAFWGMVRLSVSRGLITSTILFGTQRICSA